MVEEEEAVVVDMAVMDEVSTEITNIKIVEVMVEVAVAQGIITTDTMIGDRTITVTEMIEVVVEMEAMVEGEEVLVAVVAVVGEEDTATTITDMEVEEVLNVNTQTTVVEVEKI
jgi:hypothetical protein